MQTDGFFSVVIRANSHTNTCCSTFSVLMAAFVVGFCYSSLYILMRLAAYWTLQAIKAFRIQTNFDSLFSKNETFFFQFIFFNDHIFSHDLITQCCATLVAFVIRYYTHWQEQWHHRIIRDIHFGLNECVRVYATATSVAVFHSRVFVIFEVLFSCVFVVFGARLHRTWVQFIVWCLRGKSSKVFTVQIKKKCFFLSFISCLCGFRSFDFIRWMWVPFECLFGYCTCD